MAIEGKTIRLREVRETDLPLLVELRNNLETQGWSQTLPTDYTLGMHKKRYQEREFSFHRTDGRFIIEYIETGDPIGTISYYGVQPRLAAIFGIIVAREHWSKGIAFEAQELMLEFLFLELGLRVVRLYTTSGNTKAVQLAQRGGFQIAVRMRQSIIKQGELSDNLIMDLLREEYFENPPELTDHLAPIEV